MRIKTYAVAAIFVLSKSGLLVSFTAPNNQLPSVKSVFKYFDHVPSLSVIYSFSIFLRRKYTLFIWSYNHRNKLVLDKKLSSVVNGVVILSSDISFDIHE